MHERGQKAGSPLDVLLGLEESSLVFPHFIWEVQQISSHPSYTFLRGNIYIFIELEGQGSSVL